MAKRPFYSQNFLDGMGNPEGGVAFGEGFCVSWQRGPLGRGESRREPNGAFVETLLAVVRERLMFYQGSRFECQANAEAIGYINDALRVLHDRTREARQVEGLNQA